MEIIGIHGIILIMVPVGVGTIHGTTHGTGHHGIIHTTALIGAGDMVTITVGAGITDGTVTGDTTIITAITIHTGDLADLQLQGILTAGVQVEQ